MRTNLLFNLLAAFLILISGACLAQPTITSFTPTSGLVGTSVTITGTNFNTTLANNIVRFGATKATVTAATATQLTVTVPTGASYQPISVTISTTGLSAFSKAPFIVTFPSSGTGIDLGSFSVNTDFQATSTPQATCIADLDGDGKSELIVGSNSGSGTISIFRNTSTLGSTPTFATKVDIAASWPVAMATGDIDGDGKLDIVSVNSINNVHVFRNTSSVGSISFAAATTLVTVGGGNCYTVALGDLDNDGKIEIVAADNTTTITVFKNASTSGSVSFPTTISVTGATNNRSIAITDLDGDGKRDMVVGTYSGGTTLSVFRNTSAGSITFAAKVDLALSATPYYVIATDLDIDGKPEVVSSQSNNTISVFKNNSTSGSLTSGSFGAKVDYTVGNSPWFLGADDFDGDGKPDLITSNDGAFSFSLLRNNGSLSFATKVDIETGTNPGNLATGDLDGDGKTDIAVPSSNTDLVSVHRNLIGGPIINLIDPQEGPVGTQVIISGSGFSPTAANNSVYFGATKANITSAVGNSLTVNVPDGASYSPVSVTLNGLTAYSSVPYNSTFLSSAAVTSSDFSTAADFAVTNPFAIAVADFNVDGKPDVAFPMQSTDQLGVQRNNSTTGSFAFGALLTFATGTAPWDLDAGDLDGDGKQDLVVVNKNSGSISVFRNTSSGSITFAAKVDFTASSDARNVIIRDFDGDTKPDIAVTCRFNNKITVFRNISTLGTINSSSFSAGQDFATGSAPIGLDGSDLDGDGKLEVVVANTTGNTFSILRNTSVPGTISFAAKSDVATGGANSVITIVCADLNADGKNDVLLGTTNSMVLVYRNTTVSAGTITMNTRQEFAIGGSAYGLSIGDLDGDGFPDVCTSAVSALKNSSTQGGSINLSAYAALSGAGGFGCATNDMDADGKPEIIVAKSNDNVFSVYRNINTLAVPTSSPATSELQTSFVANWSSVNGATNYLLDVSADNFATLLPGYSNLVVNGTSQLVSGLSPGVSYKYRVAANNITGTSATSTIRSALTLPATPIPNAASALAQTSFTVSWPAAAGANSYRLDVSSISDFSAGNVLTDSNIGNVTSYSVSTGLSSGTLYYFRVRAVNGSGASPSSSIGTALTLPAIPSATAATSVTATSVSVNWSSSFGTASYQLDVSTSNTFATYLTGYNSAVFPSTTTSVNVTSLSAGTTYYYRVRAVNASGTTLSSNVASVITISPAPVASAASGWSTSGFTANWGNSTGAVSYSLDVASEPSFSLILGSYNNLTVAGLLQAVSGLSAGTTYYYHVRANNASGISANSNTITVATIPAAPNATAETTLGAIAFNANWDVATGATGYFLDVSTVNTFASFVTGYNNMNAGTSTQVNVTVPTAGSTYYYRVRAINGSGTSSNSNIITVDTKPTKPVATAASAYSVSGFTANWNAVSGATSLNLEVSSDNFSTVLAGYDNLYGAATSAVISSLSSGTTYKYRLRGVSSAGVESAVSNTITAITIPAAPTASTSSSVTTTGFTANWSAAQGATSYRLDVSTASNFSTLVVNDLTVSGLTSSVTGLTVGTTYYYRVRAVNGTGTSANSNTITSPTLTAAPTAVAATSVTSTTFTANWNTVAGATDYRIDVSTSNTFSSFVGSYSNTTVTGTSLGISGLNPSTTYYYQVRAANASGSSANSTTITTLTLPAAPIANLSTAITTTGLTANWGAVSGATSYRLDVSATQFADFVSGFNNLTVAGTTQAVTGLTSGTLYYIRVRAINASGASDNSNTISTFTIPGTATANAATNINATSFTANWGLVNGASTYYIDVASDDGFTSIIPAYNNLPVVNNFQIISGLTAGTAYYYRVRSANTSGTTPTNSNTISVTTLPVAPTANAATSITATGFTANWTNVTGATQYTVDLSTDNSFASILSQPTSATNSLAITSLLPGTNYYYRVRAMNASGNSSSSGTIGVLTIPDAPSAFAATSVTSSSFTASWGSVLSATSYRLDVATTNNFSGGTFVTGYNDLTVGSTSTSVTLPSPGTNYFYRVRAVNATGTSANSITISATTLTSAPTAIAATSISSTGFTANWNSVSGASDYRIDISTSNTFGTFVGSYNSYPVIGNSLIVSGLVPSTTYFYRVRATNSSGASVNSNTISILILPDAPVAASATSLSANGFTANWNTVTGASSYKLDVSTISDFSAGNVLSDFNVAALSSAVTGLTSGTTYYYRVRAANATGSSINSTTISTITSPAVPATSAATQITSSSFIANWSSSTGASSYQLDVSVSNTFGSFVTGYNGAVIPATSTSASITSLSAGTTYYYRVRAVNASGTTTNSNTTSAITIALPPTANNASSITTSGFTANWSNATGASDYRLDVASESSFTFILGSYNNITVAGTSQSIVGLSPGTAYYYRVRTSNASGISINSNAIAVTTIPNSPNALTALSITSASFTADWDDLPGATGYSLDVSQANDFSSFVSGFQNYNAGTNSFAAVTIPSPGVTYYYRVRATNASGISSYSNTITVNTKPATPVATVATAMNASGFTANWNSVSGASAISLEVSNDNFVTIQAGYDNLAGASNSAVVSGLLNGTTYKYRVKGISAAGIESLLSNVISTVTVSPAPVASSATLATTSGFTANWNSSVGATSYLLYVSTSSSFASFVTGYNGATATGTSASVTGLSIGTTYYYQLKAVNASGNSAVSNTITTPTLTTSPATIAATSISPTGFTANWNAVLGAVDYRFDLSTSNTFSSFVGSYSNLSVSGTTITITGLSPGTTYFYRVRGSNASGSSSDSNVTTVLTNPAAPVAIASTSTTTTGFTANWNSVTGATGYRLDVSSSEFVNFEVNNLTVAGTSSVVTGLTPGVTYKYRVRSINATGPSDNSNVITTFTVPDNPIASAATSISTTGFTANWISISGASAYFLDVSTDIAFGSFISGYNNRSVTGTSQTITGLTPGTDYYYRLRGGNASGTTGNSNVINVITIPSIPNAIAATSISATSFAANWNTVAGTAQYNLDISTDNTFSSILSQPSATGNTVTVSGLSAGTTYYYRVRATNASGSSGNSGNVSVLTFPSAPSANEATSVSSTTFIASWNSVPTATSYFIDVSTVNNFTSFVTGYNNQSLTGTSLTITIPTPGTTYYYRVRAVNTSGTSQNSNTVATLVKPSAPTGNPATAITETSFTANWSTLTGVSGYYLDVSSNNFASYLSGYENFPLTLTSQTITGLTAGSTYQYRVRSYNTTGSSVNSGAVSVITIPPAPVATNASNFLTNGFTANWLATLGASSYRIDVSSDPAFSSGFVTGFTDKVVSNLSEAVTGLTPGTIYYFRVRAVNGSGTSVNSNIVSSTNIPPPPTGIVTSNITTSSFVATWNASSGATSYSIDVSLDNFATFVGSYNNLSVTGTSITINGLVAGTAYQYRLRSNNDSGTSTNSGTVILETLPADPAAQPTALAFNGITINSMTVSYTPSLGGANGYIVLRKSGSAPTGTPVDGIVYSVGGNLTDANVVYVGSLTQFSESSLSAGTTYYYSVFAYNGVGINTNYLSTGPLVGNQVTISPAPAVTAASLINQTGFTANWVATNGADDYALDVSDNDFASTLTAYTNKTTGNVLSSIVNGLKGGTIYKYRVRAVNSAGTSINSASQQVLTVPNTPVNLTSSGVTANSFKVTWRKIVGAENYFIDLSADNFATRPVDNLSVADTTFTFSGLASTTAYKVRVRSSNTSGTSPNSEAISVVTQSVSGGSPLSILLQTTTALTIKSSPVIVEASVSGGADPKTVKFFYRKLTDTNFSNSAATVKAGNSDVYTYTITKAMLDSIGLEFYFTVTDITNTTKESNHNYVYRAIDNTSNVKIPFAGNNFNGKASTYQMFSIPYVLNDKDIGNLFEPGLNGYSNTRWRLLHYLNGSYAEYPDQLKKVELGEGYWFNTTEKDFTINVTDAQVKNVTPSAPFTMIFQQGWNQIGDPYTFNIDWSVIQSANASVGLNSLWAFEDGAYVKKNVLGVWKGAFVFSETAGVITFPLSAKTDASGRESSDFNEIEDGKWILPIQLTSGNQKTHFAAGMHPEAKESKDRFDEIVVPRFLDYLEVGTTHPEFFAPNFSMDVVPSSLDQEWTFTIKTNSNEPEGLLEWNSSSLSNLSAEVLLFDISNQVLVNMKTVSKYKIQMANEQRIKIIYRKGIFNEGITNLNTAFPNPFVTEVSIPVFTEKENANVRVMIYDMAGKKVRTIDAILNQAGYHELKWDGNNDGGETQAGGVLLYRVAVDNYQTAIKRLIKN